MMLRSRSIMRWRPISVGLRLFATVFTPPILLQWMFFDTATPGYSNVSLGIYQYSLEQFRIFPNPVSGDLLFFNEKRNEIKLSDLSGKIVLTATKTDVLNISNLRKGFYILSTNRGETTKIIIH